MRIISLLSIALIFTFRAYSSDSVCGETPLTSLSNLEDLLSRVDKECPETELKRDPSVNKTYFEELLKLGMNAPIEKFFKLWNPDAKEFESDPYFFKCQKTPWGFINKTKFIGKSEMMIDECKPDVLYTWGSETKLDNILKALPDGKNWSGPANPHKQMKEYASKNGVPILYMALTPASTYAYGPTLIRIKIKKGTPFRAQNYSAEKKEIGFWKDQLAQDFTLSDSSVIESISTGTEEIYDEMVRDLLRIQSNKRAQLYFYDPKDKDDSQRSSLDKLTGIGQLDDTYFSEDKLKENLLHLIKTILEEKGKVHYQKDSCRSYDLHYKTEKPTYFNPE